jgi:hypothetical protein
MRLALLVLAVFYAWLPSGLCACRLQAALFPPARNASDTPPAPIDDDDEGPHECHCTGSKPICDVPPTPCLMHDADASFVVVVDVACCAHVAEFEDELVTLPFYHLLRPPLYLTVRALLI